MSFDAPASRRRWLLLPLITAFVAIAVALWMPSILQQNMYTVFSRKTSSLAVTTTNSINKPEDCSCDTTGRIWLDRSFASSLGLQGNVSDCCCSYATIEEVNRQTVHPLLERVVQTPFFAHFKINLCSTCKLWDDAPLCVLRDCGVCECEQPPEWATDVEWMPKSTGPDPDCEYLHMDDQVITTVDGHVTDDWPKDTLSFLDEFNEDDSTIGTSSNHDAVVVDLRLNPEQYTGYAGQSAEKVWEAVHSENCFQPSANNTKELCAEQRVYNRILSGLHSSISLHIAHSYCLKVDPDHSWECRIWGANISLAHERVLDHPERLGNLYVAFAIVLRAVQKAGPAVTAAVPHQDEFFADSLSEWTGLLLPELSKLAHTCPMTFDESSVFSSVEDENDATILASSQRLELQRRFRHLQQIMECVGCDRCKLWGTLQTLGVGTALRVLLHSSEETLVLSRQEVVAMVHTLERFSRSIEYARELREPTL